jgi:NRAMP (natural resistance-associated macrophage protein)-like metal ion transporter
VTVIAVCFGIEIALAKPVLSELATGLIPRLTDESLYVAIGILGATVMPHNLYLHSALVQTRRIGGSEADKRTACRFNLVDSVIALNGALFVNAAILIVAATVFFKRGIAVTEIQQVRLLYLCRAVVDADRDDGRTDRHGRLSELPHAPVAPAADHEAGRDHAGGRHHPDRRGAGHL